LLNAVGLPEWCAENAEAWVAQGAAFAGDLAALQSLRQKLRQRMADSPLCDADGFARAFEATLRQAWRQWCRGC
jgi:predicted O-linked N-acetylglucosamine transferase (SPINDLY family)